MTGQFALLVEPNTATWISKEAILKVTVHLSSVLFKPTNGVG